MTVNDETINEIVDLQISSDILQGEDIPFYCLWDPKTFTFDHIIMELTGFNSFESIYNVKDDSVIIENGRINNEDLLLPGYFGGEISSSYQNESEMHGSLTLQFVKNNQVIHSEKKEKMIYGTELKIASVPDAIVYPIQPNYPMIELNFIGKTTILLDIEPLEDSEVEIVIPDEIKRSLDKIDNDFKNGLTKLKTEFPDRVELINKILGIEKIQSFNEFVTLVNYIREEIWGDEEFLEALAFELLTSILGSATYREMVLLPIIEYLEANPVERILLMSPFLHARIPPKGGELKIQIILFDVLMNKYVHPEIISLKLYSKTQKDIPIYDLMQLRRL